MSRSLKIVLGVLGGTVLVLVLLTVFAGSGISGSDLNMRGDGMMGSGWALSELSGCSSRACSLEVLSRLSSGQ